MDSNNEWNKTDIKKYTCYYLNDIIKIEDFNLDNILIDEKSKESILVYKISYKTLIDSKALHIRFDKIDGFVRVYDGTRYLVLCGSEKYDFIYNRSFCIKYKMLYYIKQTFQRELMLAIQANQSSEIIVTIGIF